MTFGPVDTLGNTFIATTRSYDLDDAELRRALTRDYTSVAYAVNFKTNGIFETVETQDGEQFFGNVTDQRKKRFVFRKCFTVPAIAAGAAPVSITTGVTGITEFTHIYGTVITDFPDKRPLPYVSIANVTEQISLRVDDTTNSIVIEVGATSPNLLSGIVVLEYLKQ